MEEVLRGKKSGVDKFIATEYIFANLPTDFFLFLFL